MWVGQRRPGGAVAGGVGRVHPRAYPRALAGSRGRQRLATTPGAQALGDAAADAADAQGAAARLRTKQHLLDVLEHRIRCACVLFGRGPKAPAPVQAPGAAAHGRRRRRCAQGPELLCARGGAEDLVLPGGAPGHPAWALAGGRRARGGMAGACAAWQVGLAARGAPLARA